MPNEPNPTPEELVAWRITAETLVPTVRDIVLRLYGAVEAESKQAEWYRQQVIEGDKIIQATEAELTKAQVALATERAARESAEKRLTQSKRLCELTLSNEIRWMREHDKLLKLIESLRDWKSPDLVLQVKDLKWFATLPVVHDARLTEPLERRVGELERAIKDALNELQVARLHADLHQYESMFACLGLAQVALLASTPREGRKHDPQCDQSTGSGLCTCEPREGTEERKS